MICESIYKLRYIATMNERSDKIQIVKWKIEFDEWRRLECERIEFSRILDYVLGNVIGQFCACPYPSWSVVTVSYYTRPNLCRVSFVVPLTGLRCWSRFFRRNTYGFNMCFACLICSRSNTLNSSVPSIFSIFWNMAVMTSSSFKYIDAIKKNSKDINSSKSLCIGESFNINLLVDLFFTIALKRTEWIFFKKCSPSKMARGVNDNT